MAMGGVGEAMLLSAAVGGGSAALTGGDPLKGALLGGLTGGLGAGISGALGSAGTPAVTTAGNVGPNVTNAATTTANTLRNSYATLGNTGANASKVAGSAGTSVAPNAMANFGATPAGAGGTYSAYSTGAAPFSSGASPVVSTQPFSANAAFNKTYIPSGSGVTPTDVIPNNVVSTGGIDRLPAATKSTFTEGMQKFIDDPIASIKANPLTAASAALSGATGARKDFEEEEYNGPLKRFKYNPDFYVPAFADGGITNLAAGGYDLQVGEDPYPTNMASGGISNLGGYSDGGRMLRGPGDGMSDSIPASISGKRPARLADGEFVIPADVVSHLGNGSTDAGAKQLYAMMNKVRQARTGRKAQGREINPRQYVPA